MRIVIEYSFTRDLKGDWVIDGIVPLTSWVTEKGSQEGLLRHMAWCVNKYPWTKWRHWSYPSTADVSPLFQDNDGSRAWQYVVQVVNSGQAEFSLDTVS